jgi:hypothetical protein
VRAARAKPTVVFGGMAVVCLALAVIAALVLSAQLAKATADFNALDKERRELDKEVKGKPVARLEEESRRIDEQLGGVTWEELDEREYVPLLTKQLEDVGAATGVEIKEIRPQEWRKGNSLGKAEGGVPVGKYGEYDLTFRFRGTFRSAFRTIQELGRLSQMVSVNELDMKSMGAGKTGPGETPPIDVALEMTAFVREGGAFPGKFVAESR